MKRPALCQILILGVCLSLTGCSETLDTSYATVQRPSINGLGLFIDMLRSDGSRVDVLPAISDRLYRYETVIIVDRGFEPLSEETQEFFRNWDTEQTLVIALRDYDWAIDYWDQVALQLEKTKPEEASDARHARNEARSQLQSSIAFAKDTTSSTLYGMETVTRPSGARARKVEYTSPDGSLAGELDVDFPLNRRLKLPPTTLGRPAPQVLWKSGDDPLLISTQEPYGPRTLILSTAAPLLNAGMVQPGNQLLAKRLIDKLDRSMPIAVVTSSFFVNDKDEISLWRFVQIYPHPWILGQSLLALILFCWWRWPILGRPHTDQVQESKRFGRHVSAVGELLATTGKLRFALQRIQEWQRVSQERRKGRRG